ncbi:MAG TPA: PAS domain-containing protein [Nitrospiraceae bacterium]|nr:PAS domain-containing protein [Nitrospiraceae bacterium]
MKAKKARSNSTSHPASHTDGQGDASRTARRVTTHHVSPANRKSVLSIIDDTVPRRSGQQRPLTVSKKERQLQAILDHSPNLVFVKDPAGRYLFVNRRFEEVFHLTREQVIHKTDDELFPPPQAAAFRTNDRKVFDAGTPLEFEEVALHDDGPHTSIVFKFPLRDEDGQPYAIGGVTTDITDRKRTEQALRESQARLALALEERRRLDADLHDNIIQMAYAVGMGIEQSRLLLNQDVKAADETLKAALTHLNQVIADVRSYIQRQDPLRVRGDQLIATLTEFIQTLQSVQGLKFTLQMDPSAAQHLTDEQSIHLYCMAHEAISNCFRHANARTGRLSLQAYGTSIRLAVEDDGIGFDNRNATVRGHGLQNISMRVLKLEGQLQIESAPGRGTRITVDVPLHKSKRKPERQ